MRPEAKVDVSIQRARGVDLFGVREMADVLCGSDLQKKKYLELAHDRDVRKLSLKEMYYLQMIRTLYHRT